MFHGFTLTRGLRLDPALLLMLLVKRFDCFRRHRSPSARAANPSD